MNNYGWICPRCNAVFAPFTMECARCNARLPTDIADTFKQNFPANGFTTFQETLQFCTHGVPIKFNNCSLCSSGTL